MKIRNLTIHNFRSIKHSKFNLDDYTVFLGANNAGKTNIFTALRIFYEDDIKFDNKSDFPKFPTDSESWIEIAFVLNEEERATVREDYKNSDSILTVRKYLKSNDNDLVKPNQSNIYGYENGSLSKNLFYGAKNISQAKLGSAIYIPETSLINEALKLSGDSPLRNVINFVMEKAVEESSSFKKLSTAFQDFNGEFKEESSKDGFSINAIISELNDSLAGWRVAFGIDINPIKVEDIIKTLLSTILTDKNLNERIDVRNFGQGLQRHLIYTLLRISTNYKDNKSYKKREFAPTLTLFLFEEPEAFLHPAQQEILNLSLKSLSKESTEQVIITTHSPLFVSKNIDDISSLVRLHKTTNGITNVFQISKDALQKIAGANNELGQLLRSKVDDPATSDGDKKYIKTKFNIESKIDEESIRYMAWLDSERCSAFFADFVLICEGATEKVFIDYMRKTKWNDISEKRIYILDSMGKYNVHRYMNLFKELGISHSVLADKDEKMHNVINEFIGAQRNEYTRSIDFFDRNIEDFLGIPAPPENRNDRKPLNVMWRYLNGKINDDKIDTLREKVKALCITG